MKMMAKIFFLLLNVCFLSKVVQAQQADASIIDHLYKEYANENHCPATVYAIVDKDKIIYSGHFGLSNIEKNYDASDQTAFRIASMTKSFVAMAILRLRDAGKINLDDPAEKYIPELKSVRYPTSDAPPLTIRNLLTHSAGFPEDNPWGDRQLAISDEQMLQMFRKGISFSNTATWALPCSVISSKKLQAGVMRTTSRRTYSSRWG
jgi:CubicO group peptidase (beta-lactamase class C family)